MSRGPSKKSIGGVYNTFLLRLVEFTSVHRYFRVYFVAIFTHSPEIVVSISLSLNWLMLNVYAFVALHFVVFVGKKTLTILKNTLFTTVIKVQKPRIKVK